MRCVMGPDKRLYQIAQLAKAVQEAKRALQACGDGYAPAHHALRDIEICHDFIQTLADERLDQLRRNDDGTSIISRA